MLNELATPSGRGPAELLRDALAGYFEELAQTREMLNSRYDDLKSARMNCSRRPATMNAERGFVLHPLAAQDITEIWEYIAEDNPPAARRVLEEILTTIPALVPSAASETRRPMLPKSLYFI